jgi:hypothetical protein
VVAATGVVIGVLIVIFVVRSHQDTTSVPPELARALADWQKGKFELAGAVIGSAIKESPQLAELDAISKPLAAPVADEAAGRVLATLLETTSLGQSPAMALALADVAVTDDPRGREEALRLLRARQRLLPNEVAVRVQLRDADTCEAFEAAKAQESRAATTATRRDLERLGLGQCKSMLRVSRLCDACATSAPTRGHSSPGDDGPRGDSANAKGKDKDKDKGGRGKGRGRK